MSINRKKVIPPTETSMSKLIAYQCDVLPPSFRELRAEYDNFLDEEYRDFISATRWHRDYHAPDPENQCFDLKRQSESDRIALQYMKLPPDLRNMITRYHDFIQRRGEQEREEASQVAEMQRANAVSDPASKRASVKKDN